MVVLWNMKYGRCLMSILVVLIYLMGMYIYRIIVLFIIGMFFDMFIFGYGWFLLKEEEYWFRDVC